MKIKTTFILNALTIVACLTLSTSLLAQDGSVDLSFGVQGEKVTPMLGPSDDTSYGMVIQSDGKIVIAGNAVGSSNDDIVLIRYNVDGSLDNSFGSGGIAITSIAVGNRFELAKAIALQADGKIVVAGCLDAGNTNKNDIAVIRYNSDGSLDPTFSGDGIATTNFGGSNECANAVAIQPDGKIVVAGFRSLSSSSANFCVVRYNTDGSLDTGLDSDGSVTTAINNSEDIANAIAIQADGKILVGGQTKASFGNYDFAFVRYNSDGSLDNTFDNDGKLTTDFASQTYEICRAMSLLPDGKILAAGGAAMAKYNTDGSLDNTFNSNGKVLNTPNGIDCYAMALQADGKIILGGSASGFSGPDFGLLRYKTNGTLDNTFSGDGKATVFFGGNAMCFAVAVQTDGKILAAGTAEYPVVNFPTLETMDFAITRLNSSITYAGLEPNEEKDNGIRIYPNPFETHTTIELSGFPEVTAFEIHNSIGETVKTHKIIPGQNLNFFREDLSAGIYFICLMQNAGVICTEKLVITN